MRKEIECSEITAIFDKCPRPTQINLAKYAFHVH